MIFVRLVLINGHVPRDNSKIMHEALTPVTSITMTDQVEERLLEFFKQRNLKPGDPIPKEVELVEALGVSRSVVREAMSRLRMLGLIDVRKRRGTVMSEPDIFSGMERLLKPQFLAHESIIQLFQLRLMLEVGLGDFLFPRLTEKDLSKLGDIVEEEKKAQSKMERVQADSRFHSELYRITRNETLIRFQKMLLPLFQYITDYNAHLKQPFPPSSVTHTDLIEVLRRGNPEEFRVAMQKHFEPHYKIVA